MTWISRRHCSVRKWQLKPYLKASNRLYLGKVLFYESEKNENERFVNAFLASIGKTIDIER